MKITANTKLATRARGLAYRMLETTSRQICPVPMAQGLITIEREINL